MGRPTKIEEAAPKIIELVRNGNYPETAALASGIGASTYYQWMKRGEDTQSGKYREFRESIKKAEAEAEALHLQNIRLASMDTWTASAWYLERKHPERWGRRDRLEHTGKDGAPIQTETNISIKAVDYRTVASALAPGSIPDSDTSGEGQGSGDGSEMG